MFRFAQHDSNRLTRFNISTLHRFNASTNHRSVVNLHDKLPLRIDVTAVHAVCIKWQCDVAVLIDCDQTAGAAELFHGVESSLSRFLQLQSRDIALALRLHAPLRHE